MTTNNKTQHLQETATAAMRGATGVLLLVVSFLSSIATAQNILIKSDGPAAEYQGDHLGLFVPEGEHKGIYQLMIVTRMKKLKKILPSQI